MKPRNTLNPKRRISAGGSATIGELAHLADKAGYGGSPEHKRNPGDFGLQPPSQPRQGKSLCDSANVTSRSAALKLLREGISRGLISVQRRQGWPQNVWAVSETGAAFEALLENAVHGTYHGYPMPIDDPLVVEVRTRWDNP